MKTIKYLLLIVLITGSLRADWLQVASGGKDELEIKVHAAQILGDNLESVIEVRIYLSNSGLKSFDVLTKFNHAIELRSPEHITLPLVFGLSKGVEGTPLKRSLEGFGGVTLNPNETTETQRFTIKVLEGEDPQDLIKKIRVIYDVGADEGVSYDDLWCGRIVIPNTDEKGNDEKK